ncbi:MAG: hypothetical protein LBT80_08385 [Lactobacillaceae bacterium]|nr:hypothetical protein [Lactobacillaceae bacterium]
MKKLNFKNMSRSKRIKLTSIMVGLALLSTVAVGNVYAKYATGGTATDQARIAKWDVDLNSTVPTNKTLKFFNRAGGGSIAPGSHGEQKIDFGTDQVDGNTEVAYKVDFENCELNTSDGGPRLADLADKCITAYYTIGKAGTITETSPTMFLSELPAALDELTVRDGEEITLHWNWEFEGTTAQKNLEAAFAADYPTGAYIDMKMQYHAEQID